MEYFKFGLYLIKTEITYLTNIREVFNPKKILELQKSLICGLIISLDVKIYSIEISWVYLTSIVKGIDDLNIG